MGKPIQLYTVNMSNGKMGTVRSIRDAISRTNDKNLERLYDKSVTFVTIIYNRVGYRFYKNKEEAANEAKVISISNKSAERLKIKRVVTSPDVADALEEWKKNSNGRFRALVLQRASTMGFTASVTRGIFPNEDFNLAEKLVLIDQVDILLKGYYAAGLSKTIKQSI